ncbi:hypothetical protein [Chroococcidiopsis sp. CCALA 051]|uniref:hypothetical protein n=1 Tax=Chroococcidiopsis sp. CCALA 051 TaxID=869949 RepID=UPI001304B5E6|nr:hypothetical protein [Chroococcidiopsis sp. CCALA 051]
MTSDQGAGGKGRAEGESRSNYNSQVAHSQVTINSEFQILPTPHTLSSRTTHR